jgi:carboxypeptidase C (cathepsin A)
LSDQLLELPGLEWKPDFNQFSGYLNLAGTKKNIHYWLVEAENDPQNAPLVFWTNGGPGCSCLIGFMTEQ